MSRVTSPRHEKYTRVGRCSTVHDVKARIWPHDAYHDTGVATDNNSDKHGWDTLLVAIVFFVS